MRCSVLQFVAVRRSALQCVAVRCSALQCVAVRCSAMQCVAVRCSTLQCDAVCCSALQCVAESCSVRHFRGNGLYQRCGTSYNNTGAQRPHELEAGDVSQNTHTRIWKKNKENKISSDLAFAKFAKYLMYPNL